MHRAFLPPCPSPTYNSSNYHITSVLSAVCCTHSSPNTSCSSIIVACVPTAAPRLQALNTNLKSCLIVASYPGASCGLGASPLMSSSISPLLVPLLWTARSPSTTRTRMPSAASRAISSACPTPTSAPYPCVGILRPTPALRWADNKRGRRRSSVSGL